MMLILAACSTKQENAQTAKLPANRLNIGTYSQGNFKLEADSLALETILIKSWEGMHPDSVLEGNVNDLWSQIQVEVKNDSVAYLTGRLDTPSPDDYISAVRLGIENGKVYYDGLD
jgi:hypothetical protein